MSIGQISTHTLHPLQTSLLKTTGLNIAHLLNMNFAIVIENHWFKHYQPPQYEFFHRSTVLERLRKNPGSGDPALVSFKREYGCIS
jgi:hypothetical protein